MILKQIPEDFIVNELIKLEIKDRGDYAYFRLKKKNLTTTCAISLISDKLNIPAKRFNYAGMKDKKAITSQAISVFHVSKDRLEKLKIKDIKIDFLGYGNERINLGDLDRNEFMITVRDIELAPSLKKAIPNYFDDQRFSRNNHKIGKSILKRDYKKAIQIILETDSSDWKKINVSGSYEKKILDFIIENPTDYIGGIRMLHKKELLIYIHAFQSYVWNRTVSEYLKKIITDYRTINYSAGKLIFPDGRLKNIRIPLVGFGTEFENREIEKITRDILKEENITLRDFVIRSMPELSAEGNERDLLIDIKNLKINELEDDDLNIGKKKCTLSFDLGKGSYATIVIKALF